MIDSLEILVAVYHYYYEYQAELLDNFHFNTLMPRSTSPMSMMSKFVPSRKKIPIHQVLLDPNIYYHNNNNSSCRPIRLLWIFCELRTWKVLMDLHQTFGLLMKFECLHYTLECWFNSCGSHLHTKHGHSIGTHSDNGGIFVNGNNVTT